jgi:MerR family transcriptional regulator/heat shock protein HspR
VTGYVELEVVAELVGLPPARIRAYQRAGLVTPARRGGRRYVYQEEDLRRLRRLRRLSTDLGLNLAGVEVVARLLDQIEQLQAELQRRGG